MRFHIRSKRKPTIIIVSLVDILTILLIFFVVSTTFKKIQPIMKVSLPEAGSADAVPSQEPVLITVTPPPSEKVFLNGREISLDDLGVRLRQEREKNPDVKIALQSDKKASFGLVVKVMDTARKAGFEQLPAFIEPDKAALGAPKTP